MQENIKMEEFLIHLRGIIKNMQKVFNKELKSFNISSSHLLYMMLLRNYPLGLTMTKLSHMSQVDKALTSRVVKELEEKNYVYRDTNDKHLRNYNICLTEKGLEVANKINEIMKK
ncbi:MAG: MarR family transcriptional regulator [Mollicutes bacterium]|nr:MarR family transcriptional regulator [Mollicutes bacterium]